MPAHEVVPVDSDGESRTKTKHRHRDDKDRNYHRSSSRAKDKDEDRGYHRSSSSKDKESDRGYHRSSSRAKDKDDDRGYHRSSSSKDKDRDRGYHRSSSSKDKDRDKDYHRSSNRSEDKDRDRGYHRSSSRTEDKDRTIQSKSREKYRQDMIIEDIDDGDDEKSDVESTPPNNKLKIDTNNQSAADLATKKDEESESSKITSMLSPAPAPRPIARSNSFRPDRKVTRRKAYCDTDSTRLNIFFKETLSKDPMAEYLPTDDDPILESISEILFKPYPWQLKAFSVFICFSQFLTLVCLFYSLLPCPSEKPSWLVFVGVPLACTYAGIESIHSVLRYIHLGKGYRILVFLMNVNCLMQLLCVGVVMGKSEDLLDLVGNFVGVAIVLQIDEFLASYIRIKDIDADLLDSKSWKTKMMLKSKIWLILIAALFVYGVTMACWRLDSLYCGSYQLEDNINNVNVDPDQIRYR